MGGMALLTFAVAIQNDVTDLLLTLIGGRASKWPEMLLIAAWAAHAFEAIVCMVVCAGLPRTKPDPNMAMRWAVLTFLVGFPVLRHVLAMQPKV